MQHSRNRLVRSGVLTLVAFVVTASSAVAQSQTVDGLTLPPQDPALTFIAPSPDQTNYASRLEVFLGATVPDQWHGMPVQLYATYAALGGMDVWGLPTSAPNADPNNPQFVYQRFQNGVLFYNGTEGTTQPLEIPAPA
jgi:hypothetical protein